MEGHERPNAAALLADLGLGPRLMIYIAGAAGAGKTYRLLTDARAEQSAGRRVAIGWIETKERPDLDALAAPLPRISPRLFETPYGPRADFDLEAALASDYDIIVLDELAHANPPGAPSVKRWQDAQALRAAGKSVLGAFNVSHLETVAPVAEKIVGHPIREIVPLSFLRGADGVIALDVPPSVLESRLRSGRIVRPEDVERAVTGAFRPSNLEMLRELLLRTVDELTIPIVRPGHYSTALALVTPGIDARLYLRRVASLASALDLDMETAMVGKVEREAFTEAARAVDAEPIVIPPAARRGDFRAVEAALIAVPPGELAAGMLSRPLDRDVYVADPARSPVSASADNGRHPYGHTLFDRLRIGYGKLTIYLGSVAGSGKTYAMLDRAHQMQDEGVDVVAALIETHGRAETAAKAVGLEALARLPNGELDVDTLLARKPQVALIDELAHTNAPGGLHPKRYDDVIAILRAGISVLTTLNIQHLEGLGDAVERLTGMRVRETLPDQILDLADEVIFIDVTPQVLRERLRAGKIYPPERIESALSNFFRIENLAALRELAVRELVRARHQRRAARPFARMIVGVAARARDATLIERMGRMAKRIDVDLRVVCIVAPGETPSEEALAALRTATRAARGAFALEHGKDAAVRLFALAEPAEVIVVESPRKPRRLFGRTSFALRLLAAGARELIVVAPRPS